MINILILGNGAREKTIAEKLQKENTNVSFFSENDFIKIKNVCEEKNIDLLIPSSEVYLCGGIKNKIQKNLKNIKIYGPNKYQAKIEGSKYFSKIIMKELNIPTAQFAYFKNYNEINNYINNFF